MCITGTAGEQPQVQLALLVCSHLYDWHCLDSGYKKGACVPHRINSLAKITAFLYVQLELLGYNHRNDRHCMDSIETKTTKTTRNTIRLQ